MNNNEEKSFTAEEVNKIIEERLYRERKQNASLLSLKELLKSLKAEGKLKGESLTELVLELKDAASALGGGDLPERSEENSDSEAEPESKIESESEETEKSDPLIEKFALEEKELRKAYPSLDVRALLSDDVFCDFYKAYVKEFGDATLLEVYGGFLKAKSIEESLRISSRLKRTPSSQRAAENVDSALTPTQRAIASKAGMSYREYAKLLQEIPKRDLRSN